MHRLLSSWSTQQVGCNSEADVWGLRSLDFTAPSVGLVERLRQYRVGWSEEVLLVDENYDAGWRAGIQER